MHTIPRFSLSGFVLATALAAATAMAGPAIPELNAMRQFDESAALPYAPDSTPFYSALDLDTAGFNGGLMNGGMVGMKYYDGNNAQGSAELGLRVFQSHDGGYAYLVGKHVHDITTQPNDAFIARINLDGSYDLSFGNNGKLWVSVPFPIKDVAMDPSGLFYFTGPYTVPSASDADFGVYCVDTGGTPCPDFGTNGLAFKAIDRNGPNDDFPFTITYSLLGAVYVAGESQTSVSGTNFDVSIVKFNSTTGEVDTNFGLNGSAVFALDFTFHGTDYVNSLLLTYPASPTGTYRLYVVGATQRNASAFDYDGFLLALNPVTGARDSAFNSGSTRIYQANLGNTHQEDEINAIAETYDGAVVLAGTAWKDNNDHVLFLAKTKSNGNDDPSFCNTTYDVCVNSLSLGILGPLSQYEAPKAIAERHNRSHDLVVGLTVHADFGLNPDHHPYQVAVEIPPNGHGYRTYQNLDYLSANSPRDSTASDLKIDDHDRVLMAGSRKWDSTISDWDMTLARMIDTDTIFVSGFED